MTQTPFISASMAAPSSRNVLLILFSTSNASAVIGQNKHEIIALLKQHSLFWGFFWLFFLRGLYANTITMLSVYGDNINKIPVLHLLYSTLSVDVFKLTVMKPNR